MSVINIKIESISTQSLTKALHVRIFKKHGWFIVFFRAVPLKWYFGSNSEQALLSAHDDVARKNYSPVLPDDHEEVDEDEVSVKIVKLIKTSEPLVSVGIVTTNRNVAF